MRVLAWEASENLLTFLGAQRGAHAVVPTVGLEVGALKPQNGLESDWYFPPTLETLKYLGPVFLMRLTALAAG